MSTNQLDKKVNFLHGFSHRTRIQILDCIKEKERTVSEIVENIEGNQSNISQHLSCLKGCGLIKGRQEGKYIYYSLRNQHVRDLLAMIDVVLDETEEDMDHCENHIV
ncbi:ArsR/SmtB family transcription factor [Oceanobacillus locisalsi]|uniref:ArsR/SmtB family transcription factor n=1 Tax=Oceanobacillus locisalsi TaxID=546107 RepID=A0ABW3NFR8_9BACI